VRELITETTYENEPDLNPRSMEELADSPASTSAESEAVKEVDKELEEHEDTLS